MYKTLKDLRLSNSELIEIIHYVVNKLNKSELTLLSISSTEIAEQLFHEIESYIRNGNEVEMKDEVNKLYNYLSKKIENEYFLNSDEGKMLLNRIRES